MPINMDFMPYPEITFPQETAIKKSNKVMSVGIGIFPAVRKSFLISYENDYLLEK